MKLELKPVDFGRFVAQTVAAYESAAEERDIDLSHSVPPRPVPALLDLEKCEKVLNNLVSNALKFTGKGGKVRVALSGDDQRCSLVVKDTGCGIPEDKIGSIFQRFQQVDGSTSRKYEGTGIGLSLAKELVELHGGTISVRSEPGFGSEFAVEIPRGRVAEAELEGARSAPGENTRQGALVMEDDVPRVLESTDNLSSADRPAARILVAEDNADMQLYMKTCLKKAGYSVRCVPSGARGFVEASRDPPDLIVSDLMMPDVDGVEFLKRCKASEKTRSIPFILLTAKISRDSLVEALESGVDDYVIKPFDQKELLARVERLIRFRQVREENQELSTLMRTHIKDGLDGLCEASAEYCVDIQVLKQLIEVDVPSALNKTRYITERLLHELCERESVAWGDKEPTLERMIGPLVSKNKLPKNIAVHIRTIQSYTSPGSHYQKSALSETHSVIALQALVEVLEWFLGAQVREAAGEPSASS